MMQQKQFRMEFLCFQKKQQKPVSLKKNGFKQTGGLDFKENGFFSTLIIIFQSFFAIFP